MLNNDGNVFYFGDFDDSAELNVATEFVKQIQKQRKYRDGRIDIWINSFGGYAHLVYHLIELVEVAKRDGIVVRTIVPNIAFSAGSMLAVAGTPGERYIAREAEHLIHYGQSGSTESTPKQIERWTGFKNRDFKHTLDIYKKYAAVPNLDSEMMDDGFLVPAPKAIKYNLADKYMEKFDIGYNL